MLKQVRHAVTNSFRMVFNEHTCFVPIVSCSLLVLYCPVCGRKYEEKLRTLPVFTAFTCNALERKPRRVRWESHMTACVVDWPLPKVPRDATLVAGGLLFLTVLWSSIWTVPIKLPFAFWSVIVFQISNCLFPIRLWNGIWSVPIKLPGRFLISNSVSYFGPFVSY